MIDVIHLKITIASDYSNNLETNQFVNLYAPELFVSFFIYLKLELQTQFKASNDKKILLFTKNIHLPNRTI